SCSVPRQLLSPAPRPLATLSVLCLLCKEAGARQLIHSCQVFFLLLMLKSCSDANLSITLSLFGTRQRRGYMLSFTPGIEACFPAGKDSGAFGSQRARCLPEELARTEPKVRRVMRNTAPHQ
ncbi:unnamed protein product, partial [Pleuronectes platessa]